MKKIIVVGLALLVSTAAQAQRFEAQQVNQRINRLESEIQFLQRQLARGEVSPLGAPGVVANAGQAGAEIARIDEEMRSLRGQVEQVAYEVEQTNKRLDTMQKDLDYRLQQLSAQPEAAAEEEAAAPLVEELAQVARTQEEGALAMPSDTAPMSARDLYNHAFKLLNQTNYTGAISSFQQFTKKFGDDPLVGNAWYWLGEAFYVQRDYVKAADSFRQGFQKLPDGPKAGDNLLKLGMSLSALERKDEACVVLKQVKAKYAANSEAIKTKAQQEMGRLDCR